MNIFHLRGSALPQASPSLYLFPSSSAAEVRERSLILTPGKQTKESPHKFISWSGRQFTQSKSPPHCCQMNGAGSWSPRRLPRERPLIMLPLWEPSTRDILSAGAGPCPGALSSGGPGAAGSEPAPHSQWQPRPRPRPRRDGWECRAFVSFLSRSLKTVVTRVPFRPFIS